MDDQKRKNNVDSKRVAVYNHFMPLLHGLPVLLKSKGPVGLRKARAERPWIAFTPMFCLGHPSMAIMISVQARGCEVTKSVKHIKFVHMIHAGIDERFARIIVKELEGLF